MGIISEVSPQRKNKGRVNLFIDGEFVCGLDAFTAAKYRLREGTVITPEKIEEIAFESECASAFEKSMNLINNRLRSEKETVLYLTEKNYSSRVVARTVEKLKEYGFLCDRAFATAYIESHRSRWGIRKIEYSLKSFGVDTELIEELITETPGQSDEAYQLAVRFQRGKTEFDKRKLFAHLAQKGFESDMIRMAIERLQEEIESCADGN